MGFYSPGTLIESAKRQAVPIFPMDVNHSVWDSTLERTECGALGIRIGLRSLKGFGASEKKALMGQPAPYASLDDLVRRTGLPQKRVNVVIWKQVFEEHVVLAKTATLLGITGTSAPRVWCIWLPKVYGYPTHRTHTWRLHRAIFIDALSVYSNPSLKSSFPQARLHQARQKVGRHLMRQYGDEFNSSSGRCA